ncbi:sensor histidine kinase [Siccirubricoccus deserti]
MELSAQRLPDIDAEGRVLVRLEVRDTGPGVPEAQRRAVFGDFVQLDSGSRMGGTGLGLAIAAGIAGQMDGRIGCGANPAGQGRCSGSRCRCYRRTCRTSRSCSRPRSPGRHCWSWSRMTCQPIWRWRARCSNPLAIRHIA